MTTAYIIRIGVKFLQRPGVAFSFTFRDAFRFAKKPDALGAAYKLANANPGVPVDVFDADTLARVAGFVIESEGDAPTVNVPQEVRARAANYRWKPADAERARECETAFQRGGPRVYLYDGDGTGPRPSPYSATRALELADAGQTVCARRKSRSRASFEWSYAVAE